MIINMLEPMKTKLTNEQKEAVIAQVLQTYEGRIALIKAMVEPIK